MKQVFVSYTYLEKLRLEFGNMLIDYPNHITSNEEFLNFLNDIIEEDIETDSTILYFKIMDI